jgi:hypothetical protein
MLKGLGERYRRSSDMLGSRLFRVDQAGSVDKGHGIAKVRGVVRFSATPLEFTWASQR